jgi:type VI protein secretion system component VasF
MSAEQPPEELTAAERRLAQHLSLLRPGPAAPTSLTDRVVQTARWQQAIRSPLRAVASLAAAAGETIRLLLGAHKQ